MEAFDDYWWAKISAMFKENVSGTTTGSILTRTSQCEFLASMNPDLSHRATYHLCSELFWGTPLVPETPWHLKFSKIWCSHIGDYKGYSGMWQNVF
jgi:hypothetical protein